MLKLETFNAVKLRNDQLFTVIGGEKSTTWTNSNGTNGTDTIADDHLNTSYYMDGHVGEIEYIHRTNDGNL